MFGKVLTRTCVWNIIAIINNIKDPSISYKRCWRISDNGRVLIHTHKFVDQNGREFDIAENHAFILLHIFDLLVK